MMTLYGIKNCDTVRKARRWLEQADINYQFHDFRSEGLDAALIQVWINALGWEALVNKRSTTWRNLPEESKNSLSEKTVIGLLIEQPTLIKRPVLDKQGQIYLGFKEQDYQQIF
ncbi:MAG: ArsC family reductase [Pseudomonadales bacterium]|nr:ArsC family reductase [Pseudomonadales bacterium]